LYKQGAVLGFCKKEKYIYAIFALVRNSICFLTRFSARKNKLQLVKIRTKQKLNKQKNKTNVTTTVN